MNILATTLVLWVTYGVAAAAGSDAPGMFLVPFINRCARI